MKNAIIAISMVCATALSALGMASSAHAQAIEKVKDGDKIKFSFSRYEPRGRDVAVAKTEQADASIAMSEKTYAVNSPLGGSTYLRETHVEVDRTTPEGAKTAFSDIQQLKWFPIGGDFSKLAPGEIAIENPRCGRGTFKYVATSQPAKFKLTVSGKDQELDVNNVTLNGRWWFSSCGSGEQVWRFAYSPQLDFVVEREQKAFLPNGFLSFGNLTRINSIN
jgi:hypothetical protein